MTPAGARLDDFLRRAMAEFSEAQPSGDVTMPEVGGKSLAGNFRDMLTNLRKSVDDAKLRVAAAVTELQTEIAGAEQVARQLEAEAIEVRSAFGEVLGNAPPAAPGTEQG